MFTGLTKSNNCQWRGTCGQQEPNFDWPNKREMNHSYPNPSYTQVLGKVSLFDKGFNICWSFVPRDVLFKCALLDERRCRCPVSDQSPHQASFSPGPDLWKMSFDKYLCRRPLLDECTSLMIVLPRVILKGNKGKSVQQFCDLLKNAATFASHSKS